METDPSLIEATDPSVAATAVWVDNSWECLTARGYKFSRVCVFLA